MSVAVTLVATVVPVHAATAASDSSGAAPSPSPLASGGAAPTRTPAPAPVPVPALTPLPAPGYEPEVAPEPESAPDPGWPGPGSASAPEAALAPAAAPPLASEPFAEPEVPPAPDTEKLTAGQTPEPERPQGAISLNGVPALVAREQLGGPVAFNPPGEEPQLRQLAQVRDEPKRGGGVDVQVPLNRDQPVEPAPPATARPQELPRAGLEVIPLASIGFAMVIAGLGMLRVVPRRAL